MKTDLLEHFNNIDVKDWELYSHNIGLKPTTKYKAAYWIRAAHNQLQFYSKEGTLLSTVSVTNNSLFESAVFSPNFNRMYYCTRNSGVRNIDIIEVSTGTLIMTLTVVTGSFSIGMDVDAKGNLYVLNANIMTISKYDKDGNLLSTSPALGVQQSSSAALVYWKKENVLWYTSANSGGGIIVDATSYTTRISGIGTVSNVGMFSDGALWSIFGTAIRLTNVDYNTNVITGTSSPIELRPTTSNTDWTVVPLGEIKGILYFGVWRVVSSEYYIAEIDGTGNLTHINVGIPVYAMDNDYYYSYDSAAFKIYKKSDKSLVNSITSAYGSKLIGDTKGAYQNFKEYW